VFQLDVLGERIVHERKGLLRPNGWAKPREGLSVRNDGGRQPFDLSTARRTKEGRRRPKGGLSSLDLREGVAGGARKDPEAAVTLNRAALMARWPGKRNPRPGRDLRNHSVRL
jgi:hypothetical protein